MNYLLAIASILVLHHFPLLVNATGSPASTHPPSNIDWNSLETLFEIPSLDMRQCEIPIEENIQSDPCGKVQAEQEHVAKKKWKKIRYPDTLRKSYLEQKRKIREDPAYAKRRKAQSKAASARYRAKRKLLLSKKTKT